MNVLIIGTGGIGGFYGALLAKAGARVSVVCRSDFEAVRERGITVRSHSALGTFRLTPVAVVRSPAELPKKPDYVLLCVKVVEGVDRVALLRDALGPETRIVLISNGVEIEAEIAEAYPGHELISGLAFICVSRTAPGEIRHEAYGRLVLGAYPGGRSTAAERLCQTFRNSGIDCEVSEDIVAARWQKCVWNAPFNPLSVLSGGLDTAAILSTQEAFVRAIMADVCRVAEATGHPLPADIIDRQTESTRRMPPYKTSMLLDYEAGRPLETEAILGNAVRAARREGSAAPYLESLYALLKLRELQLSRR
jgi:2-dehydropantoate 2-reductase